MQSLRLIAKALDTPISYLGNFENLPENTIGQRIKKARLYHGLTKKELAEILNINPKTLANWEQDKQTPLKKPKLNHLCFLLYR